MASIGKFQYLLFLLVYSSTGSELSESILDDIMSRLSALEKENYRLRLNNERQDVEIKTLQRKNEDTTRILQNHIKCNRNFEKQVSNSRNAANGVFGDNFDHTIKQKRSTKETVQQDFVNRGHRDINPPCLCNKATPVAFSAYVYAQGARTYTKDAIIQFDSVILNDGGGYNGNVGVFVCPLDGIYLFSYNLFITDNEDRYAAAYLKINGSATLWTDQQNEVADELLYSNARGTTVVRLTSGTSVWVAPSLWDIKVTMSQSNFMGVLISE